MATASPPPGGMGGGSAITGGPGTPLAAASAPLMAAAAAAGGGPPGTAASRRNSAAPLPLPQPVGAPVFEKFHSFKEFMALQKDTLEAERAVELYSQYQFDFKVHTARVKFAEQQREGFVRQRYHPEGVSQMALQKKIEAREAAAEMVETYHGGGFSRLKLDWNVDDASAIPGLLKSEPFMFGRVKGVISDVAQVKQETDLSLDPETVLTREPWFAKNLNEGDTTLVLQKLPGDVERADILEAVKDVPGVKSVTLLPSCICLQNQVHLESASSKGNNEELTEEENETISSCYVKPRGSHSTWTPLQTCWITFNTAEECAFAEIALEKKPIGNLCTCHPLKVQPVSTAIKKLRICGVDSDSQKDEDLELCKKLVRKLDKEFEVIPEWSNKTRAAVTAAAVAGGGGDESMMDVVPGARDGADAAATGAVDDNKDNKDDGSGGKIEDVDENKKDEEDDPLSMPADEHPFIEMIQNEPRDLQLDLLVTYLRRVHAMDYYSGRICWSSRELFETAGAMTVRLNLGRTDDTVIEVPTHLTPNGRMLEAWQKRIDSVRETNFQHWLRPMDETHPLFKGFWDQLCREKTLKVDAEKYRCGICRKLFKGPEYVHKHLKNKHATEAEPLKLTALSLLMRSSFDYDDFRLLLFVSTNGSNEGRFTFGTGPPQPGTSARIREAGSGYAPQRRTRPTMRSGPMSGGPDEFSGGRGFRDWDAPRTRLSERSTGGTFRQLVRYDDL